MIPRPKPEEYGSFYEGYISHVEDEMVMDALILQGQSVVTLLRQLSPEQANYRYAENKWSVRQVVGHLIDTERVMSYRALCISRGETVSLPGFDQDLYVDNAAFEHRSLQNMAAEYDAHRNSTISMFNGFTSDQLRRSGTANESPFTVRALAYVIAGHERHHMQILEQKYGVTLP